MDTEKNEWEVGDKEGLVSIGTHKLYISVLGPPRLPSQPIIIIFPGSGAACDTWKPVSKLISSFARVLLYDRSGLGRSDNSKNRAERESGSLSARELSRLLEATEINAPYVLVAHSYGGCVAREFLQLHSRVVVGTVLSETGTETKCEHAEEQYKTQILGDCPLSVIRGEDSLKHTNLSKHNQMFTSMIEVDKRLKREQLQLSKISKFRNVPDCGHSVHLDRPDVVAEEVRWVLNNPPESSKSNLLFKDLRHDV